MRPANRWRIPASERTPYQRLIHAVAKAENIPAAHAQALLERFVAELPAAVWGLGRLVIPNLGSFRVSRRKSRRIRNPQTNEMMRLPAVRAVAFRASKNWRVR